MSKSNSSKSNLDSEAKKLSSGIVTAAAAPKTKKIKTITPSDVTANTLRDYAVDTDNNLEVQPFDSGVGRHPLFYHMVKSIVLKNSFDEMKEEMITGVEKMFGSSKRQPTDYKTVLDFLTKANNKEKKMWEELANSIHKTALNSRKSHEAFYSGGLTRSLNFFCLQHQLPFTFVHQMPCPNTGTNVLYPDICVYYGIDLDTYNEIGINEVTKDLDQNTILQLGCYLSHLSETYVSFGLTIDIKTIKLYGFCSDDTEKNVEGRTRLDHSLLHEQKILKDSAKLFQAYFLGLAIVSDDKIRKKAHHPSFCPIIEAEVKKPFPKVFRATKDKKLFKLFDYGPAREEGRKPNIDIMRIVHAENDICLHQAEDDTENKCKVYVLETPWFDGDHEPTTLEHVRLLCDQLQELHDKGFVHGDVLRQNIIFGKNDKDNSFVTKLIDFDYSGPVKKTRYPETWNTEFAERHHGATRLEILTEMHDVYAAIVILCLYFQWNDEKVERDICKEFFAGDQKPSKDNHPALRDDYLAGDVSNWITKNMSKLELKANASSDTASSKKHAYDGFVQTGSPPALLRKKN